MTRTHAWTKEYCNMSHLLGLPEGWQITIERWETGAQVSVYGPPLKRTIAERDCTSVEDAKAWAEDYANHI